MVSEEVSNQSSLDYVPLQHAADQHVGEQQLAEEGVVSLMDQSLLISLYPTSYRKWIYMVEVLLLVHHSFHPLMIDRLTRRQRM